MSDNDYNQNDETKASPLKAILLIAVVLVVAGTAFMLFNRAGVTVDENPELPNAVENAIDEANPFPQAEEQFNLPPQDEMVTDDPNAATPPGASTSDATGAAAPALNVQQAMGTRSIGDQNAPVKLQEYFSLTCNHCASFHNNTMPALKKYIDSGELYIEFHEFPLNAPALRASMIARCLPEDKYYGFITLLFKTQDTWTTNPDYMTPLRQNAKLAGMTDEQFDACMENNDLQQALGASIKEATDKWKIESTPTFIVNGGAETIKGAQPAYEFERVFRTVTGGKVAPLADDQQTEAAPAPASETEQPDEEAAPETTTETPADDTSAPVTTE